MTPADALRARARATRAAALACPHRAPLPGRPGCAACVPEARCALGRGRRRGIVNLTECCQCVNENEKGNSSDMSDRRRFLKSIGGLFGATACLGTSALARTTIGTDHVEVIGNSGGCSAATLLADGVTASRRLHVGLTFRPGDVDRDPGACFRELGRRAPAIRGGVIRTEVLVDWRLPDTLVWECEEVYRPLDPGA